MNIEIRNIVIGGGNTGATYTTAVGATQSFTLDIGQPVTLCWYSPIDNVPDLVKFSHIEVEPSGNDVILTIKPNEAAILRILIYVVIA